MLRLSNKFSNFLIGVSFGKKFDHIVINKIVNQFRPFISIINSLSKSSKLSNVLKNDNELLISSNPSFSTNIKFNELSYTDTIVQVATGNVRSGISIIRISGCNSYKFASIIAPSFKNIARTMQYINIYSSEKVFIHLLNFIIYRSY